MGFYIFSKFIPYYGFFILIGIVFAFILGFTLCKVLKHNTDDFIIVCAYLLTFGIFGAKILFIIVSFKDIDFKWVFANLENFNSFLGSGFIFYGGLIGGLIAFLFIKLIHKIPIYNYIKIITPCLAVAHAFGRIGCSFAGCCYGKKTLSNFYFIYSHSISAPNNVKLLPVQGIESVFLFSMAILFTILVLKKVKLNIPALYIVVYSVFRFIIEFWRGDVARGFLGFFSTSQLISFIFIISIFIDFLIKKSIKLSQKKSIQKI